MFIKVVCCIAAEEGGRWYVVWACRLRGAVSVCVHVCGVGAQMDTRKIEGGGTKECIHR